MTLMNDETLDNIKKINSIIAFKKEKIKEFNNVLPTSFDDKLKFFNTLNEINNNNDSIAFAVLEYNKIKLTLIELNVILHNKKLQPIQQEWVKFFIHLLNAFIGNSFEQTTTSMDDVYKRLETIKTNTLIRKLLNLNDNLMSLINMNDDVDKMIESVKFVHHNQQYRFEESLYLFNPNILISYLDLSVINSVEIDDNDIFKIEINYTLEEHEYYFNISINKSQPINNYVINFNDENELVSIEGFDKIINQNFVLNSFKIDLMRDTFNKINNKELSIQEAESLLCSKNNNVFLSIYNNQNKDMEIFKIFNDKRLKFIDNMIINWND